MLKKSLISFSLSLPIFLLLWLISSQTLLFDNLEKGLANFYYFIREPGIDSPNSYISSESVLIGADDNSLAVMGKWPWRRNIHGEFLDNLQAYSPKTVMFDFLFVNREKMPSFVAKELHDSPKVKEKLANAYEKMDDVLANAIGKYNNVYIDLELVSDAKSTSPAYKKRIQYTEKVLHNYSLSLPSHQIANSNQYPIIFKSIEPLIKSYVDNARLSVINVLPDQDGVIRNFPLYFPYKTSQGKNRNLLTIVSLMLAEYYRVPLESIEIEKDKMIIPSANVPNIKDHRPVVRIANLANKINSVRHQSYRYNHNLYNLLVNDLIEYKKIGGDGKPPPCYDYPVHLKKQVGEKEQYKVLDTWETLDACRKTKCPKTPFILYFEKDIIVKTSSSIFNSFPINYGSRENIFYRSMGGNRTRYNHIPTHSYKDVYLDKNIPSLPLSLLSKKKLAEIEKWFYNHCLIKSDEIKKEMDNLGIKSEDDSDFMLYIAENPLQTKYYLYARFFDSSFRKYSRFLDDIGIYHDKVHHLKADTALIALREHYRQQFRNFHNKFVFSGINYEGIGDTKQTPYGSMFGINIIINSFNTIITRNQWFFLRDIPHFNIGLLFFICLLFSFLYTVFNVRASTFLFIISSISFFIIPIVLFHDNIRLEVLSSVAGNSFIFMFSMVFKILTEGRDKKFLKSTFSTYLSPEVIEDMYNSKQKPKLGGEAGHLTAYFTDIEKFSTFSEKLSATNLVDLLNEYLSSMTDILLKEQGTLDKYIGDAVVAFVGAPKALPDHAFRACRIALKMQEKLIELREKWSNETTEQAEQILVKRWPEIVWNMQMRIGINTGDIVVGNMGSTTRMNYTMMGDAVNLAARLESAAKQYGVYILVSQMTLDDSWKNEKGQEIFCRNFLEYRYIDRIRVVGKEESVAIYEIISLKGQLSEKEKELKTKWQTAISLYLDMKWKEAKKAFKETEKIERHPNAVNNPSKVMISRCALMEMKAEELIDDEKWDGTFDLLSK